MKKKIVFTNGCFDILHEGHLQLLNHAKSLGDILVVAINSDSSVKRLKGKDRPVNDAKTRARNLYDLKIIDHVCIFEEDIPYNAIKGLKPNIIVKGGDYKEEDVVGRDLVDEVVIFPYIDGYSTSDIIKERE